MPAIFSPSANTLTRFTLLALAFLSIGGIAWWWLWPRMDYRLHTFWTVDQPVPFSHKHHVSGLGLDCRYCHISVEYSSNAGLPPTETCMTCHSQIWTNAAMLAPVRQSLAEQKPLRWTRVYTLPDYVYFDHSIHIAKGVGCTECHGPIGDMPLTRKATTLYMSWCLACHRDPAPHLRPREQVFNPHWKRTAATPSGKTRMAEYHSRPQTLSDFSECHL